ncbi:lytic transglycosylase domain-containing protein [bacterium]|nr:lytic transglycosylase domain-containing protein [bacterium]
MSSVTHRNNVSFCEKGMRYRYLLLLFLLSTTPMVGCSNTLWSTAGTPYRGEAKAPLVGERTEREKSSPSPYTEMLPSLRRIRTDEVKREYARLLGNQRRGLLQAMARAKPQLPFLARILASRGVPPELLVVPIVESEFRPTVASGRGAVGLWQFTKITGRHYGLRTGIFRDDRKDPLRSTDAAARHLRDLYQHFSDWPLALAAYNAGITRVRRACSKRRRCDYWELIRARALPPQTRRYVPRILATLWFLEEHRLWPFPQNHDMSDTSRNRGALPK